MKKRVNVKFIKKELIPFILREHGRGFAMSTLLSRKLAGSEEEFDEVSRIVPSCGIVCCIKGSVAVIKGINLNVEGYDRKIVRAMGLTKKEAYGLFYDWKGKGISCAWPRMFAKRFFRCKTPLSKAKVAVALLEEVCRTDAKCLHKEQR